MTLTTRPYTFAAFVLAAVTAPPLAAAEAGVRPHGGMLRDPDVSATHIAFRYADDLWLVPREGGVATPLASPPGEEARPRFSPDGGTLAFEANYDGDRDLYTLPVAGGSPVRVTHHPGRQRLCDWTPDGRLLFYMGSPERNGATTELFTVAAQGGLPQRLPVPYGSEAAMSPDGDWLAYSPNPTDYYRTWKRYAGGTAADVWLFHLEDHRYRAVTAWQGSDTYPMWHGETVYYLSNAGPSHRENLWAYDPRTDRRRQITRFTHFDVKSPAMGPGAAGGGEIVFSLGEALYLLDLETGEARSVEVRIPGARPRLRPRPVDVAEEIRAYSLSPSGRRVAVEARGDIWTLPAEEGTPRNLTRSSGVGERSPAWSPDGRWIAFFSDRSGEYELHLVPSDGRGEERQLTSDSRTFYSLAVWSPDSESIAFVEKNGALWLHTLASGETRQIADEPWARYRGRTLSWSPDSRWLAYERSFAHASEITAVWLYDAARGESHQVTSGMHDDRSPVFDRKGEYLYYVSRRSFEPRLSELDFVFAYLHTQVLVAVPLRGDLLPPGGPKSDEESWDAEDEAPGEAAGGRAAKAGSPVAEEVAPVEIEVEGFQARARELEVAPGTMGRLEINDQGQLLFLRRSQRGKGDGVAIKLYDFHAEEPEEKTLAEELSAFDLSARGDRLVAFKDGGLSILEARPDADAEPVVTDGMWVQIEPRAEWRQLFHDSWRLFRDFFYDPSMHGLDWAAIRDRYAPMLDDCASRRDVSTVIREMLAELNVGHAGLGAAPGEEEPKLEVGLLGADFALHRGAYRFDRIIRGAAWNLEARNPLEAPGVRVREGEYLLAVNGVPVDTAKDPWAAFLGLAGRTVTLTVGPEPRLGKGDRDVVVEALAPRGARILRYYSWLERNRRFVDEKTGGRVGYVFVPNYLNRGMNSLVEQFFPQRGKEALIIDQRWNGGGYTPHRFLEILNRPVLMYRSRRDGEDRPVPNFAHFGPKCLLINELSGSSGDMFPWMFRHAGLGKLIGRRTWGGVVGLSGNPNLIDGQRLVIPNNGTYSPDGRWIIEGHGVDPDLEVPDDPSLMVDGGDPQLEAAVAEMLRAIEEDPYRPPQPPAGPDRSGMGIVESER